MEGIENYSEQVSIKDPEEAREFIFSMIEKGDRPCVSIPLRYLSALKNGLKPHSSWIPGFCAIVGTLGREPYIPNNEVRRIIVIKKIDPQKIHPRFTGPDNAFHGVVVLDGPIEPDSIEVIN